MSTDLTPRAWSAEPWSRAAAESVSPPSLVLLLSLCLSGKKRKEPHDFDECVFSNDMGLESKDHREELYVEGISRILSLLIIVEFLAYSRY